MVSRFYQRNDTLKENSNVRKPNMSLRVVNNKGAGRCPYAEGESHIKGGRRYGNIRAPRGLYN